MTTDPTPLPARNRTFFLLGAADPEMSVIADLLKANAWVCARAQADGAPVHPGNAYRADLPREYNLQHECILVECGLAGAKLPATIIDHHRPGDPGYGQPPARFWPASSIGQVFNWLAEKGTVAMPPSIYGTGKEATLEELALVAAADHCLSAAYRGECPGIDPDRLMDWRIRSRAAFQKRDPAYLFAAVLHTMDRLQALPANNGIVDVTGEPGGTLPELPEAAARLGIGVIATTKGPDGRWKDVLVGSPSPQQIAAWIDARRIEGREVYGDPARGFAGAYRREGTGPDVGARP